MKILKNRRKPRCLSHPIYIEYYVFTTCVRRKRACETHYACVAEVNWFRLHRPARCYHSIWPRNETALSATRRRCPRTMSVDYLRPRGVKTLCTLCILFDNLFFRSDKSRHFSNKRSNLSSWYLLILMVIIFILVTLSFKNIQKMLSPHLYKILG